MKQYPEWLAGHIDIRLKQRALFETVLEGGPGKWAAIRKIYKLQEGSAYSPYFLDWGLIFTPIEHDAWHYIRFYGLSMYPQFPVGRYFVDFGDPALRLAIECDGAAFHDKEKDAARDADMLEMGWKVFRFTGSSLWMAEDRGGSAKDEFSRIASHYYGRTIFEGDE